MEALLAIIWFGGIAAYFAARQVLRPHGVTSHACAFCGYDLSGIDRSKPCPECGKGYETQRARNPERGLLPLIASAGSSWPFASVPVVLVLAYGGGIDREAELFFAFLPYPLLQCFALTVGRFCSTRQVCVLALGGSMVGAAAHSLMMLNALVWNRDGFAALLLFGAVAIVVPIGGNGMLLAAILLRGMCRRAV